MKKTWTRSRLGRRLARAAFWAGSCVALTIGPSVTGATAQQPPIVDGASTITADDLARRVGVIAHDSMQGRDTPSPGLEKTAVWVASEFRRLGLSAGGDDGGFIQRYPLRAVSIDPERSSLTSGSVRLGFGEDLLPLFGEIVEGEAVADLVLVSGSGSVSRGTSRAVEGKHVVLVLPEGAAGVGRETFQVVAGLRNAGARSVMVTNGTDDARWASNRARSMAPSVSKDEPTEGGGAAFLPLLQIRTSSLTRLMDGSDLDLASLMARGDARLRVDEIEGARVTLVQRTRSDSASAPNVVGILEGSDPSLRDEYVVYSAHMDHVGIGAPDERGDSIFNGADDDASGTAAVIEVAEAMAGLQTPPRRSMVFLVVSGEEKGLWGSEWYAANPSVPLASTVANLNADMVGRNWPDTIVAIGKEHSDLGATLERVNAEHPELGMTAIDDLWPEERFYFRSDHFNFARRGVPILFFFNGTHEDYHGRADEPDRIDAEKASRIARLLYYLGVDIGNADERPQWNPESYARIVSDDR
jgi:Zn-dependent M28 family amino/carboxypeptidase